MITVNEMVKHLQTKEPYEPLLSSYSADFWTEYTTNALEYDNYFNMMFKNFVFFDQEDGDTIDIITNAFTDTVTSYLKINNKRLSELWRINVVPDDESYSITENYYMQETYSGTNSNQSAITTGQRTDINNVQVGSQTTEVLNKVTAFNSGAENTKDSNKATIGTRNDIEQFTKGKETDTSQSTGQDGHTLTRHGALGVMTVTDVLKKQEDYWKNTELFYEFVFKEIAEKFLLLGC